MDKERVGKTNAGGSPSEDRVEHAITLLRTAVPVDAGAFDVRVLSAIQQGATPPVRPGTRVTRGTRSASSRMTLLIGATALAASVTVAAALHSRAREPLPTKSGAPPRVISVAPRGEQIVRFSLVGARAAKVTVAGSFNGWNTSATPLRRVGNATWVADVPLKAGRYVYQFVLDDHRWVQDPNAPRDPGDDFGKSNSVVTVVTQSGS